MNKKFVKIGNRTKKFQKSVFNAASVGQLSTYIKHPITGEYIKVHPDIVKKITNGEKVTLYDIENQKFN